MARLRYNGLSATLNGGGLTNTDTTVTFAAALTSAAGAVPTLAGGDYIPLVILDATGQVKELVNLTAYTSGALTGTIARAQEGTTAVAHAGGVKVVNGPTAGDFGSGGGGSLGMTRVDLGADAAIGSTTWTQIQFGTEVKDELGIFDPATPGRVTIVAPGRYEVRLNATVNTTGLAEKYFRIRKNNVEQPGGVAVYAAVAGAQTTLVSDCVAGDYFQADVYSASGSPTIWGTTHGWAGTFLTVSRLS